jgi:hypothetical protein
MDIPIVLDNFRTQLIAWRPGVALWRRSKLVLNGNPVPRKGLVYIVADDSGQEVVFRVHPRSWDPIPDLMAGEKRIELVPPLKGFQQLWLCLPALLLLVGGVLGALCGLLAISFNYPAFRRVRHPVLKYLVTGLISAAAPVLFLIISLVLFYAFGFGAGKPG